MRGMHLMALLILASGIVAPVATLPLTPIDVTVSTACGVFEIAQYHPNPAIRDKLDHYVMVTYVNMYGLQLAYYGEYNETFYNLTVYNETSGTYETIDSIAFINPVQLVVQHYKSPAGEDILSVVEFLALIIFNESINFTMVPYAPDPSDEILYLTWRPLTANQLLALKNAGIDPIPMMPPEIYPLRAINGTIFEWGISYLDLYLSGWRAHLNSSSNSSIPVDMLFHFNRVTFNYTLEIDTTHGTATMLVNYEIGPIMDIWKFIRSAPGNYTVVHYDHSQVLDVIGNSSMISVLSYMGTFTEVNKITVISDSSGNTSSVEDLADVSNATVASMVGGSTVFAMALDVKPTYSRLHIDGPWPVYTHVHYIPRMLSDPFVNETAYKFGWVLHVLGGFFMHTFSPLDSVYYDGDIFFTVSFPVWGNAHIVHDPAFISYYAPEESDNAMLVYLGVGVGVGVGATAGIAMYLIKRRRSG